MGASVPIGGPGLALPAASEALTDLLDAPGAHGADSCASTALRARAVDDELAAAYDDLETLLRPLGMQRTRAERLIGLASALVERFDGVVPQGREALMTLPGVGRKTANVVLGNAFGRPAITVDTHVGRLSRRLGWTTAKDPVRVERDLSALWEPERWTDGCHRLIEHGRAVCGARAPRCGECVLLNAELCPQVGV